jgi:hypothetical protein
MLTMIVMAGSRVDDLLLRHEDMELDALRAESINVLTEKDLKDTDAR